MNVKHPNGKPVQCVNPACIVSGGGQESFREVNPLQYNTLKKRHTGRYAQQLSSQLGG